MERGETARLGLVAKQRQRLRTRSDEDQAGIPAQRGEGSVLAQESIARVDGVAARFARGGDDGGSIEIGRRT